MANPYRTAEDKMWHRAREIFDRAAFSEAAWNAPIVLPFAENPALRMIERKPTTDPYRTRAPEPVHEHEFKNAGVLIHDGRVERVSRCVCGYSIAVELTGEEAIKALEQSRIDLAGQIARLREWPGGEK